MIELILLSAAAIASYNCEVGTPQSVTVQTGKANVNPIGLPPAMAMRFSITLSDGDPGVADVTWPGDPMQMAGKVPFVSTAPGAYAFSSYSPGPCLFTETECIAQVNLVDLNDSSANVIITPAALVRDEPKGTRTPFIVVLQGTCSRSGAKK